MFSTYPWTVKVAPSGKPVNAPLMGVVLPVSITRSCAPTGKGAPMDRTRLPPSACPYDGRMMTSWPVSRRQAVELEDDRPRERRDASDGQRAGGCAGTHLCLPGHGDRGVEGAIAGERAPREAQRRKFTGQDTAREFGLACRLHERLAGADQERSRLHAHGPAVHETRPGQCRDSRTGRFAQRTQVGQGEAAAGVDAGIAGEVDDAGGRVDDGGCAEALESAGPAKEMVPLFVMSVVDAPAVASLSRCCPRRRVRRRPGWSCRAIRRSRRSLRPPSRAFRSA